MQQSNGSATVERKERKLLKCKEIRKEKKYKKEIDKRLVRRYIESVRWEK